MNIFLLLLSSFLVTVSCEVTVCFTIVSSLSAVIFISFLDVNECEENNGGCEQQCVNKEGSHNCSCEGGFKLENDGFKCTGDSIKRVNFREPNGTISNKGIPVCELDFVTA